MVSEKMNQSDVTKDISIIGGSVAGFFTAYLLANEGCQVRVFEAAETIDPPPRSLIVTKYFQDLLGPIGDETVINKIRRFEIFTDGRAATISLTEPDLVIEREGAQIVTGKRFLDLEPNGGKLQFTLSGNGDGQPTKESTDTLVGADGAFSSVARSIGHPDPPTVFLTQAVVDLPNDLAPDTTRVWFVPEETPYFFWLIPHSSDHGVLGLIGNKADDARQSIERFLDKKNLTPIEFQSARIADYTGWRPNRHKIGSSHVYLVGDAAGHVKVSTVGGVVTGLRGSMGTAQAIMNGGSSIELEALRKELDRHRLIRWILNRFGQTEYSQLIDLLTPSTKRSLSQINRDEANKLLRSLVLKQPRLLLLALRTLIFGQRSQQTTTHD
ncbi:MAG: NAD(P)/FAD-dependent oxidoreductase [Deltaproteobacteria bacterium]|nr:NAD(P)/FAD-dependent oxidoreductase [Deltaproteobacteria bacterium]